MARRKISPIINKGIAFIADGDNEQWYINQIKLYYNKKINITPYLPKLKNIKEQYELVEQLFQEGVYDKIIWIIDLDQDIKENNEANNTKNQVKPLEQFKNIYKKINNNSNWCKKVTIIINNPCLEFWYLLHKKLSYKYYRDYYELIPDLKKFKVDNQLFEKYKKNKDYYKNLFKKLLPSLKKMDFSKLKAFDINKCESESCSEMYKLFEVLDININNDNI